MSLIKIKNSKIKFLTSVFIVIIVSLLITSILRAFFIETYQIEGSSMNPSLYNGDRLIISKLFYGNTIKFNDSGLSKLKKGDLVVFKSINYENYEWYQELLEFITLIKFNNNDSRKILIKRVIALPGERIQISRNLSQHIYINGKLLRREFVSILSNYKVLSKRTPMSSDEDMSVFREYNGANPYLVQYSGSLPMLNNNYYEKSLDIYIPKRGDKLVLYKENTNSIMKIEINGKDVSDNWRIKGSLHRINEETNINLLNFSGNSVEYIIQNDYYFVLGDNRDYSSDSNDWGILREDLILGKPVFRIHPFWE